MESKNFIEQMESHAREILIIRQDKRHNASTTQSILQTMNQFMVDHGACINSLDKLVRLLGALHFLKEDEIIPIIQHYSNLILNSISNVDELIRFLPQVSNSKSSVKIRVKILECLQPKLTEIFRSDLEWGDIEEFVPIDATKILRLNWNQRRIRMSKEELERAGLLAESRLQAERDALSLTKAEKAITRIKGVAEYSYSQFRLDSDLEAKLKLLDEITCYQQLLIGKAPEEDPVIGEALKEDPNEKKPLAAIARLFESRKVTDFVKRQERCLRLAKQAIEEQVRIIRDNVDSCLSTETGPLEYQSISALYEKEHSHQLGDCGIYETCGLRESQQDAMMMRLFDHELDGLTAQEIGYRLWTTLKTLDAEVIADSTLDEAGATASVTVVNGSDIITATIGDSVAFAVLYDAANNPYVIRLNHRLHSLTDAKELSRLCETGTPPQALPKKDPFGRPTGEFELKIRVGDTGTNMSRSVGDRPGRQNGMISDPDIDITSIDSLITNARTKGLRGNVSKIQVITTCDGFTEGVDDTATAQQNRLEEALKSCEHSTLSESALAKECAEYARLRRGSKDNISVGVQTISRRFKGMMAVFDGHGALGRGGHRVARCLALKMGKTFAQVCALLDEAYRDHPWSVYNHRDAYLRDHPTHAGALDQAPLPHVVLNARKKESIVAHLSTVVSPTSTGSSSAEESKTDGNPFVLPGGENPVGLCAYSDAAFVYQESATSDVSSNITPKTNWTFLLNCLAAASVVLLLAGLAAALVALGAVSGLGVYAAVAVAAASFLHMSVAVMGGVGAGVAVVGAGSLGLFSMVKGKDNSSDDAAPGTGLESSV